MKRIIEMAKRRWGENTSDFAKHYWRRRVPQWTTEATLIALGVGVLLGLALSELWP